MTGIFQSIPLNGFVVQGSMLYKDPVEQDFLKKKDFKKLLLKNSYSRTDSKQ